MSRHHSDTNLTPREITVNIFDRCSRYKAVELNGKYTKKCPTALDSE